MKPVNILSLFDGMACGMLAMMKAGLQVNDYFAFEIDKYAIQTAKHNFPQIKECGDVFNADFKQYRNMDYLIGGSPCFTKGHYVLTDKGYKDVSDIQVGDMVLTHKGRYKPVIRTNKRESKVCEIKAMGYPTFTTTAEHPFYTIQRRKATYKEYQQLGSWRAFDKEPKWTAAKDLTNAHFVGMHIGIAKAAQSIDKETAYILGRYVADGHLRKTRRTGRKNSYQYQVVLSIGAEKLKQFKDRVKHHHFSCYPHSDNVYRCVFSSKELLEFIRLSDFGEGAINKNIPELIHEQPTVVKEMFLKGYIEGDGCYIANEDKYSMSTVSPRLAFGLQRLISSLWQTNVSVSVSNNLRPHKIDGREIKANYPLYTVCAKMGVRKQTVAHVQDGIMWTQIKSVTPTEREDTVYNIEVADDNSYTVNNCIVHNCTYWSIAQSPDKRETTASGIGWELFSQYVRALHEAKPKFFIYENNKSMSKAIRESITETFGFEAICVNSALVSAQNRQRLYWVGKRNDDGTYSKVDIEQPEDRGILLRDVIDGEAIKEKSSCIDANYYKGGNYTNVKKQSGQRMCVAEPVNVTPDGKSQTIKAQYSNTDVNNICKYTSTYGASGVAEPVRCFTLPREDGVQTQSKQYRVYDVDGKSTTLCAEGGGMGAKTGLYAVPVEFDGGIPVKAISGADGKTYTVYSVKDGVITIKGKQYPIKLIDGYYIIRKLTVSECKRLQTVPEWYEFPVSDTQAYKMLGNGWTVDVIAHLIEATMEEG